jgi:dTDP-4-amino-4,6-dideoxygalactose transaminase
MSRHDTSPRVPIASPEPGSRERERVLDVLDSGLLADGPEVRAFSFYPTKNMTTGEGGMVVTDDESIAERAAHEVASLPVHPALADEQVDRVAAGGPGVRTHTRCRESGHGGRL